MIDLSYEPKKIFVRIDGVEYEVAERKPEIDEQLQRHNENLDTMSAYDASYNLVRILLGDEAVKKIFPNGKSENLNRMYYIAKGKLDTLAQRSKPVIDMIDRSNSVSRKRR